jgi:hypothetical protein
MPSDHNTIGLYRFSRGPHGLGDCAVLNHDVGALAGSLQKSLNFLLGRVVQSSPKLGVEVARLARLDGRQHVNHRQA